MILPSVRHGIDQTFTGISYQENFSGISILEGVKMATINAYYKLLVQ
ncbi:MAG: hypothetical protein M1460_02570 [Candidatus Thermoplasmatota archaeon]|jgi:hypothetical protein|nr:hypothetical protein [Candidatus Thermoplasmatota archaeon]MCL5987345.1 hypothetical protein [Candidatus Thermoplasmatota archaeon]